MKWLILIPLFVAPVNLPAEAAGKKAPVVIFEDPLPRENRDAAMKLVLAIRLLVARFGQFLTRNDGRYLSIARQLIRAEPLDSIEPVSKALMDLLVQYLSNHPEYMKIRNIPTMAYILVNAGIFVVLRQLTSENPPVTYEQVGEGLAYLVSYYVDREIAQGS